MNILLVNQYALPSGFPGNTRHGDLGRVLTNQGHKVSVLASSFDYLTRQIDRTETNDKASEHYFGVKFLWVRTTAYTQNDGKRIQSMVEYTIKAIWKGLFLKKEERPDVVIASSPHLLSGVAGALLSIFFRVPFVLEVRDLWPSSLVDLGALQENSLTNKILLAIEYCLYQFAKLIVGVPPLTYKRLEELDMPTDKVIHIPNGIFPIENTSEALPNSLKKIFELEADRKIIMYTGAHGIANDLANVLTSINELKQANPEDYERVAFVFIGGGQQRESLIEQAKEDKLDHVYFHKPIPKPLLKKAIQVADALLFHLASADVFKYGISPNKLYDYLEAGKPILFSSVSPENLIDEIQAGISFESANPEKLSQAISKFVSMPTYDCRKMGEAGQEYVNSNHNWNQLGFRMSQSLTKVCEDS